MSMVLNQGGFCNTPHPQEGIFSNVWTHFWLSQLRWMLLASSSLRPGMMGNIPQYTGQPTTKNDLVIHVSHNTVVSLSVSAHMCFVLASFFYIFWSRNIMLYNMVFLYIKTSQEKANWSVSVWCHVIGLPASQSTGTITVVLEDPHLIQILYFSSQITLFYCWQTHTLKHQTNFSSQYFCWYMFLESKLEKMNKYIHWG